MRTLGTTLGSVVAGALALAPLTAAPSAHAASTAVDPATGQVTVVQAVPGAEVDLAVDGRDRGSALGVGSKTGPLELPAGTHRLRFGGAEGDRAVTTRVTVRPGSSTDVVLHLPASPGAPPVVSTYRVPSTPLGPGKARVLLAHTATVVPADVVLDGTTVFTNIANGEYAEADVPAGTHRASLVATGTTEDPILGPLSVDLAAGTATMVYAVGNPRRGSMQAITHVVGLRADGSVVPRTIDTGSAGLVRGAVVPFTVSSLQPRGRSLPASRP
ncbi:protein of unknown function [Nocardioides scoriae]|uniref:DUF4397 domain-containing protein n=1 Tax=Nocardioides scoriae TaxID=642780 RepID=A0A1H1LJI1_9ACTN|nr:DUF4397 domain-containing protein [Nocardioides scoriae]SDR74019.1 protein of unknown function [Nocardioides scoriae]